MKNKNTLLAAGQLTLAGSIILIQFVKENPVVSFFIGLLIGLSVVFNITYLLKRKKDNSPK